MIPSLGTERMDVGAADVARGLRAGPADFPVVGDRQAPRRLVPWP